MGEGPEKYFRKGLSAKTGTVMQGSNLGIRKWMIAAYLLTTNLKGVSGMKLRRDLGITQKAAWRLIMRLRETRQDGQDALGGPLEVDETCMGGNERNRRLNRCVNEFAGRRNNRRANTVEQPAVPAGGMEGKRLGYREFTA